MSLHQANAYIELEIAKIAKSYTPAPDRTFIEGMIEMAVYLGQLPHKDGELYREAAAIKAGNRALQLRSAA